MKRALLLFLAGCPEELVPVEPMIPVLVAPCDAPAELNLGVRAHTVLRLGDEPAFFRVALPVGRKVSVAVTSDREVEAALFLDACPADDPIAGPSIAFETAAQAGSYLLGMFGPSDAEVQVSIALSEAPDIFGPGTCTEPMLLDLSSGRASLSGSFADALDEQRSSCSSDGAREIAVRIELSDPADLEVVTGGPSVFLFLRAGTCESGGEILCATYNRMIHPHLEPGTYFVFLEQHYDTPEYDVTFSLRPPTLRPDHDRCDAAVELTSLDEGTAISGSFLAAEPSGLQLCDTGIALYYRLSLERRSHVWVRSVHGNADLSLWPSCAATEPVQCDNSDLCSFALSPGDYVLRVARPAYVDPDHTFDFVVSSQPAALPAPNDRCETALDLLSNPETVTADFAGSTDATLFYRLTLSELSDVTLSRDVTLSATLLVDDCSRALDVSESDATYYGVPPGSHVLRLTASYDRCTPLEDRQLELTVSTTPSPPPPPNDTCASVELVQFPGGVGSAVSISGTTRSAIDDANLLDCDSGPIETGPEVFYQLDIPVDARLRVTEVSGNGILLSLHSLSCDAIGALECGNPSFSTSFGLFAGTYFMRVEQRWPMLPGDFELVAELLAP